MSEFLSDLWAFLKHRKKLWLLPIFYLFRVARWVSCSHTAIEFSWIYLYAVLILIKRADDSRDVLPNDMGLNLGCAHIGMAK